MYVHCISLEIRSCFNLGLWLFSCFFKNDVTLSVSSFRVWINLIIHMSQLVYVSNPVHLVFLLIILLVSLVCSTVTWWLLIRMRNAPLIHSLIS